ncbi:MULTISPECIES: NAD(P)/FAD-dependent oxidoreductase [Kyrpidia]|uniref:NAD(P)/FAD-dependent oxidoreductase n=1 Tax=Kyrpidia TaxID=1129704 RepID=UPI00147494B5|nr:MULTISPECIES: FAD-dependent oxidoreductase [Kyrpidia]MCL6574708.1 NAD(P)/FAD-dependent oxidoreductase [Kyrpidia sp.]
MSERQKVDLAVVGAGPAGISAGIWAKRVGLSAVVIEAGEPGGQLRGVRGPIPDYPGWREVQGPELARALVDHLLRSGTPLVDSAGPVRVDTAGRRVHTAAGEWEAEAIVLATGARPRRLGIPGEAAMERRGEVWSASRDAGRFRHLPVVVIGGGDRALEGAWLLAEAGAQVTIVHRRTSFRARREWRERVFRHPGITVMAPAWAVAIQGSDQTQSVRIRLGGAGEIEVPAAGVFVRIGTEPNLEGIHDLPRLDSYGVVAVDRWGRTSLPGIYAAGDVCTPAPYTGVASAVADGMRAVKAAVQDMEGANPFKG